MKRALLLLALSACARTQAQLSPGDAAAIETEVGQVLTRIQRYSSAQRWDSLVTVYSADPRFRWAENGAVRYRSRDAIRAGLRALPAGTRIQSTYRGTEVTAISPGLATLATTFETRMIIPPSDSGFTFGGAITMLLIKEGTVWRILEGHTSSTVRGQAR